jgi:hypothetical protein
MSAWSKPPERAEFAASQEIAKPEMAVTLLQVTSNRPGLHLASKRGVRFKHVTSEVLLRGLSSIAPQPFQRAFRFPASHILFRNYGSRD